VPYTLVMTPDTRETRASACEIKFIVDERQAAAICAWARANMQPDPHGNGPSGDGYTTSTLYFDTRHLDVFHRRDSFGRAKYRVRRYGDAGSVFFERKLRLPGVLIKRRTLDSIESLENLEHERADAGWVGHWFHRRLLLRRLRPVCQVTYDRTARVAATAEGLVRFTLDGNLRASRIERPAFAADPGQPLLEGRNVLELKYRARIPAVFRRLIEEFALTPQTASKYRLGVAAVRQPERAALEGVRSGSDAAAYA
jgi:VTC domain